MIVALFENCFMKQTKRKSKVRVSKEIMQIESFVPNKKKIHFSKIKQTKMYVYCSLFPYFSKYQNKKYVNK